jgi:hypothetical protein
MKNSIYASLFIGIGVALTISNICNAQQASYPIDAKVMTTVERTIQPVAVPLAAEKIYPYELSKYTSNGYGAWKFGAGLPYEKRSDLMPSSYKGVVDNNKAKLLKFFTMTDIHLTDKESPTQGIYFGTKEESFRHIQVSCFIQLMFLMQQFKLLMQ